jgi:integrase
MAESKAKNACCAVTGSKGRQVWRLIREGGNGSGQHVVQLSWSAKEVVKNLCPVRIPRDCVSWKGNGVDGACRAELIAGRLVAHMLRCTCHSQLYVAPSTASIC